MVITYNPCLGYFGHHYLIQLWLARWRIAWVALPYCTVYISCKLISTFHQNPMWLEDLCSNCSYHTWIYSCKTNEDVGVLEQNASKCSSAILSQNIAFFLELRTFRDREWKLQYWVIRDGSATPLPLLYSLFLILEFWIRTSFNFPRCITTAVFHNLTLERQNKLTTEMMAFFFLIHHFYFFFSLRLTEFFVLLFSSRLMYSYFLVCCGSCTWIQQ